MKYKKILCLGIAAIMFITGTVFCVSAESTVSVSEHEKTEKNVNTEFDQIGEVIEIPCENLYSTRATTKRYSINWTVPAGAALSGSSEIYMYVGDTVTFDLTYSPVPSDIVEAGLLTPIGEYRHYEKTNGVFYSTMTINRPGIHRFRVKNESSVSVTITGTFTTSITPPVATTWFSQKSSSVGTTWSSTNLTKLYCPNMSTSGCDDCTAGILCANIPWYTTTNNSGHINKWGCSISSIAMIFRNLKATTVSQKYDFRNGTTTNQSADPFTISMANIYWPTITQSGSKYVINSHTASYSPVFPYWDRIASAFGLTPHQVVINSGTDEDEIADILAYYINNNPEGILVRIANSHSLVFTGTTHTISSSFNPNSVDVIEVTAENEMEIFSQERIAERSLVALASVTSTDFDDKFVCYDPATTNASESCNVTYDNTWTADYYGGIDLVNYIYYFD